MTTPTFRSRDQYGVDFRDTDAIAISMGFGGDDPCRLRAALEYELSHNAASGGHVFLPREKLLLATSQLIGENTDALEITLDKLGLSGEYTVHDLWGDQPDAVVSSGIVCSIDTHGAVLFKLTTKS